jgi:hypothetical protein
MPHRVITTEPCHRRICLPRRLRAESLLLQGAPLPSSAPFTLSPLLALLLLPLWASLSPPPVFHKTTVLRRTSVGRSILSIRPAATACRPRSACARRICFALPSGVLSLNCRLFSLSSVLRGGAGEGAFQAGQSISKDPIRVRQNTRAEL